MVMQCKLVWCSPCVSGKEQHTPDVPTRYPKQFDTGQAVAYMLLHKLVFGGYNTFSILKSMTDESDFVAAR